MLLGASACDHNSKGSTAAASKPPTVELRISDDGDSIKFAWSDPMQMRERTFLGTGSSRGHHISVADSEGGDAGHVVFLYDPENDECTLNWDLTTPVEFTVAWRGLVRSWNLSGHRSLREAFPKPSR
jgi:hypothetical protein